MAESTTDSAFEPRVALASLSGQADAAWARAVEDHVGAAFLGGVALDEPSRRAARQLVERDREEFLPENPVEFIDAQLAALDGRPLRAGVNVRSATLAPIREAAKTCADHDAIVEVNAHCRQEEVCAVGCGETLLRDAHRLCEHVEVAAETGATVSVKVRAEVPGVDLPNLSRWVTDAGADVIHIDAMDTESVIEDVADALDERKPTDGPGEREGIDASDATPRTDSVDERAPVLIANNGVRDAETTREYLARGADAVSVGRPSDRPAVLRRVRRATDAWFAEQATQGTSP